MIEKNDFWNEKILQKYEDVELEVMLEKAAKRNEMLRIENLQLPRKILSWPHISKSPGFTSVNFDIDVLLTVLRFGELFSGTRALN